ncbi:MAG: ABC transporter permease [Candidatus Riflebacteria bacterium]|nr:ABC transporter permease [Candidatus Riflebacteria bacterium]
MIIANGLYFFREAITNCRRAILMTGVTVSSIAVSLLLIGSFFLASLHLESFLKRLQNETMITAFCNHGLPDNDIQRIAGALSGLENVAECVIISPAEALADLFLDKEDQKLFAQVESENPLPYSMRLKVKSDKLIDETTKKIKAISGIESVQYGEEAVRRFKGISDLFWMGTLLVTIFLGLASFFIVYNTISLTLFLRKEEIIIMRLVGATNWFIRMPFLIEGLIQGILGAFASLILLLVSYKFIAARIALLVPFFSMDIDSTQLWKIFAKLFMIGIILGISGSLFSLKDLSQFSKNAAK